MHGGLLSDGVPVWLVAMVLAGLAPLLVRLYSDRLERDVARRTRRFVARMAESEGADEVKGVPREDRANDDG